MYGMYLWNSLWYMEIMSCCFLTTQVKEDVGQDKDRNPGFKRTYRQESRGIIFIEIGALGTDEISGVSMSDFDFVWLYEGEGRRQWHPTPVLLLGKSHGRRSLVGCSPWGCQESDMTERFTFTLHFQTLEKEMATHSSVLAWRSQGPGEPGGLPPMGSHRVRHD